eukprot:TRINITY_DN26_c0_g2_i2.p1 TRINITY_DN26_c0_g2~~TRINITY_DN26_c0_g2_i2.p1  ORF type:complete len:1315 (-),score=281.26 TRINITY_DN26_c0_g2_i2:477-4421(-)
MSNEPQRHSEDVTNPIHDERLNNVTPPHEQIETSQPSLHNSSQAQQNVPRLAIQRLRLENFKSYGGVVDVGPFHKSFSSIVGPNGSGKSNVIDAMLFVFGRRAKQLRHSKLSELLHHSATYPNVQSATVTVFFHDIIDTGDGDNDFEVVDGSSFAVARRAFRNNSSKYYLDDREVKMSEVVELLKSKGVDLDNNRFLILQGEVEQIAMMKPKAQTAHEDGLLEYLEDIIGSNQYIEKIEATSSRVETLNEERSHKMNRVKAAERERNALDDAKTEAENYLDKERELLQKKLRLSKANRYEVGSSLKENRDKYNQAKDKVDQFRSSVKEKEENLKVLENDFNETQRKSDLAVKVMNDAKEKYSAFERKDIKLREDIKAAKANEKKQLGIVRLETKRQEEHAEKLQHYLQEKNCEEEKLPEIEDDLKKAQSKVEKIRDKVKSKTEPIREQLEAKQADLLPFSESVNACRKELQISRNELKLLVDKLETPKRKLEECEKSLSVMEEDYVMRNQALTCMREEMKSNLDSIRSFDDEIARLKGCSRELSQSSSDMLRKVEEARAAREFSSTRSRLHTAIIAASKSGVLKGVVGRLGDLASVDPQFSVAVGAAAGASLDNIVVHTAEQSQACIQFLRRENLGRATFVILEKIGYLGKKIEAWEKSDRRSDGPRLFDKLHIPNSQNRNALYYALRDTLVSKSLEEARRMAFKPTRLNRVVTLAGELIESSGAMTGGGRGPPRYRLGSGRNAEEEMSPRELQTMTESLETMKQEIRETEDEIRGLMSRKQEAISNGEQLEANCTRAGLEVKSLNERIVYMKNNTIPSLRSALRDMHKASRGGSNSEVQKRKVLETTVSEKEKKLHAARELCDGLEKDITQLQEQIVAAGGVEMQNAKEAVERLRKELGDLQSSISTTASRADAAEQASFAASEAVKRAEAEIASIRSEIENLRKEKDSMTDDAQVVFQKFKESEGIYEEWAEKVRLAQEGHFQVKESLKKLRREEISLVEAAGELHRLVIRDGHELRSLRKRDKELTKKMQRLSMISIDIPAEESQNEDDQKEDVSMGPNSSSGEDTAHDPENDLKEEFKMSLREKEHLMTEINVIDGELANMNPNIEAIAEYKTKDAEYKTQVKELDELTTERDETKRECDRLRRARLDGFMTGFGVITLKLKELYQMITLGGDAELELVDSLDPFSEGIVFSVRPPRKSWKNISNLSGGEKTLSSLALVFALHHYKPTPLYFLDEIDAALDYKNVSIVANYVKDRTKNAQFIIISLRNNMFELADRLVGIYKTYNTTKSVTIDPSAFSIPTVSKAEVPIS